jgi:hypothetical protein
MLSSPPLLGPLYFPPLEVLEVLLLLMEILLLLLEVLLLLLEAILWTLPLLGPLLEETLE